MGMLSNARYAKSGKPRFGNAFRLFVMFGKILIRKGSVTNVYMAATADW